MVCLYSMVSLSDVLVLCCFLVSVLATYHKMLYFCSVNGHGKMPGISSAQFHVLATGHWKYQVVQLYQVKD